MSLAVINVIAVIAAGAALGALFAAWAGPPERTRGSRIYAIGLVVLPLVYVGLALVRGGGPRALLLESAGLVRFGAAALLGSRAWPPLIGFGWIAHVAWDVGLHAAGASGYAPPWYAPLCVGFDIVVGTAVLYGIAAGRRIVRR